MPVVRFITSNKIANINGCLPEALSYMASCCPCHSHQKTTMKLTAIHSEWHIYYVNMHGFLHCNMQTGKQLNVRDEVAHFYDSNQLSTAALLRFLTAWANWSNRASVLECSHVLASISQVKIGSQYSGIKVKRHETPKEYFKWFILCVNMQVWGIQGCGNIESYTSHCRWNEAVMFLYALVRLHSYTATCS